MSRLSDILDKASDAYADDKQGEAYDYYKQAEKLDSECVEALEWLGELCVQADKVKEALGYYKRAEALNPKFAEYANLGYCYYELGHAREAVVALGKAIAMNANDVVSHSNYGKALYDYYVNVSADEARALALEWMRNFPNNTDAKFMGAALSGEGSGEGVPVVADSDFVRDVFDDFADDFDSKLAELEYAAPRLLAEILAEYSGNVNRILDLGCGTGLLGIGLRSLHSDAYIYGIDLSSKMLERAKGRDLYDGLECCEIGNFLGGYSGDNFDVIMAADVFCYFGDLVGVLGGCRDILGVGGLVVFSVELLGGAGCGYDLHESGRYRHGEDYILGLGGAVGLDLIEVRRDTLRTEYGSPVVGLLVVMRKNDT